jgi:hypothetical protein
MYDFCKNIEWFMSFYELLQSIEFGVVETFCDNAFLWAFAMDKILVAWEL